MDENLADIVRRVNEWDKSTKAAFEKLASRSNETDQSITPDEIVNSLLKNAAFYGLATKYHETMGRLARFYNENIIEEKFPDVPEVAWGQKLKKLFEIEESFYKQAKEAFAGQERENFEIYSGLATEALDQIRNSVEKADTPVLLLLLLKTTLSLRRSGRHRSIF